MSTLQNFIVQKKLGKHSLSLSLNHSVGCNLFFANVKLTFSVFVGEGSFSEVF